RANGGSTSPRDCKAVTVPAAKSAGFAGCFGRRCLLLLKSCPQTGQDCVGMHTGVGAGTATLSRLRIGTAAISVAFRPWPARQPTGRLINQSAVQASEFLGAGLPDGAAMSARLPPQDAPSVNTAGNNRSSGNSSVTAAGLIANRAKSAAARTRGKKQLFQATA